MKTLFKKLVIAAALCSGATWAAAPVAGGFELPVKKIVTYASAVFAFDEADGESSEKTDAERAGTTAALHATVETVAGAQQ